MKTKESSIQLNHMFDNYTVEDYISAAVPVMRQGDIEKIKQIQEKLESSTQEGLTIQEAEQFLDWLTYNARNYANAFTGESMETASFALKCSPTQQINTILLEKMGIPVYPFNTGRCLGDLPKTEEEIRAIQNGWSSHDVRHAVAIVELPIKKSDGIDKQLYLLDPTFRQFCLKENCKEERYRDEQWIRAGHEAPHPGYFLSQEYLEKSEANYDTKEKSRYVLDTLIENGYIELSDENAKIYGDAFAKASINQQFATQSIQTTGRKYKQNFMNDEEYRMKGTGDIQPYLRAPKEYPSPRKSLWKSIREKFLKIFKKEKLQLEEPKEVKKEIKSYVREEYGCKDYGETCEQTAQRILQERGRITTDSPDREK